MQVPLSFPQDFVLWFIGTLCNNVQHPKYGSNMLTKEQLKYSSGEYKSKLYKCIADNYVIEPALQRKYKYYKEPDLVRSTSDDKLPLLIGNLKNERAIKMLERRLSNASKK